MTENKYVIAGLGNPGPSYENTRHNAGFMAIDRLVERAGGRIDRRKFEGLAWQGRIAGADVLALKPQTYMNLSGKSINAMLSFYKIPVERLIVIYDDFAIPTGTIRIRKGGSDGGHNGIASIILETGRKDFTRLRIGTGPLPPGASSIDFVLSRFSKDERDVLEKIILDKAADAAESIMRDGLDRAMNEFNRKFSEIAGKEDRKEDKKQCSQQES